MKIASVLAVSVLLVAGAAQATPLYVPHVKAPVAQSQGDLHQVGGKLDIAVKGISLAITGAKKVGTAAKVVTPKVIAGVKSGVAATSKQLKSAGNAVKNVTKDAATWEAVKGAVVGPQVY